MARLSFRVTSIAAVTAGLTCPPLMWPKHCTMVAMLRPKHREMRTRSAGGGFSSSSPALQVMVEPRLRRTKMKVARYSPDTALQNPLVQTPLKAAMMSQRRRNALAEREHNTDRLQGSDLSTEANDPARNSLEYPRGSLRPPRLIPPFLSETHQKREHAAPLCVPDEPGVLSLMSPATPPAETALPS